MSWALCWSWREGGSLRQNVRRGRWLSRQERGRGHAPWWPRWREADPVVKDAARHGQVRLLTCWVLGELPSVM